jgi:hypothetical protein
MTILVLLVAAGSVRAVPETITYEIITDESLLSVTSGSRINYTREYDFWGQFQLVVDYDLGTAAFQNVNVTLEEEIMYIHYPDQYPLPGQEFPRTDDLNELYLLTELESTIVTSTGIDFQLIKNIPGNSHSDIYLELTFDEDLVYITGGFTEPGRDTPWYDLDATATVVPEPATILFIGMGGLLLISHRAKRGKRKTF